ncbi:MAG: aminodeoxychorismate/anthranilate synthase component II [Pirellulales bacterium]|nr:aminodeoxychorismate/anthranilate synthase component II [Pirellulales bacterium]
MLLLIDNYDSFVFNLARYFERLGQEVRVARNDTLDVETLGGLRPAAIVLSPGPCTPAEAGVSLELVRRWCDHLPILGICLGHQTIAAALGGNVVRAAEPMHGQASRVWHDACGIFADVPNPLVAGRYHSLVVAEAALPASLRVTARADQGVVMAVHHRQRPVVGLQFHPESILTESGYTLLANFLRHAGLAVPARLPSIVDEHPPAPRYELPAGSPGPTF